MTSALRVLVVEDEPDIAALIAYQLTREGFRVETAGSGPEALDAVGREVPDLVVLDRMLPGLSGDEVLVRLKSEPATMNVPVLLLTAKREQEDRIEGLELGADDYLTKPFSFQELIARLTAIIRRGDGNTTSPRVRRVADLELDMLTRIGRRGDRRIEFSNKEFQLLDYFLRHIGQVVTRTMLIEAAWDYSFDPGTNLVDVHISRLRAKLEAEGEAPLLHTVRGAGYRLDAC